MNEVSFIEIDVTFTPQDENDEKETFTAVESAALGEIRRVEERGLTGVEIALIALVSVEAFAAVAYALHRTPLAWTHHWHDHLPEADWTWLAMALTVAPAGVAEAAWHALDDADREVRAYIGLDPDQLSPPYAPPCPVCDRRRLRIQTSAPTRPDGRSCARPPVSAPARAAASRAARNASPTARGTTARWTSRRAGYGTSGQRIHPSRYRSQPGCEP